MQCNSIEIKSNNIIISITLFIRLDRRTTIWEKDFILIEIRGFSCIIKMSIIQTLIDRRNDQTNTDLFKSYIILRLKCYRIQFCFRSLCRFCSCIIMQVTFFSDFILEFSIASYWVGTDLWSVDVVVIELCIICKLLFGRLTHHRNAISFGKCNVSFLKTINQSSALMKWI